MMVATLSLRYDDCRRPSKGRPRGGSVSKFKTTPCPAGPRRGPEEGVYRMEKIFLVRV
jgi:hypothetical protein